jgi:DNA-binding CsgD family transcriptional regulator
LDTAMVKSLPASATACFMLDPSAWVAVSRKLKLSPREFQIAQLVFQDRKEAAIARSLGMSPHTVRSHMERLYRKLGVRSRVELVLRIAASFLSLTAEEGSSLPPICGKTQRCPLCR